jgi:recombinational DNA repair protein RecR
MIICYNKIKLSIKMEVNNMYKSGMVVKDKSGVIILVQEVKDLYQLTRRESFKGFYELNGLKLNENLEIISYNLIDNASLIHSPFESLLMVI